MELLLELARGIGLNKTKRINVVTGDPKSTNLYDKFYRALAQGRITSDEEAMALLYPKGVTKSAYHKLKSQLLDRVYTNAYFIDFKARGGSDLSLAKAKVLRLGQLTFILAGLGMIKNRRKLLRKLRDLTDTYQLTLAGIRAYHDSMHLAGLNGNQAAFQQYKERYLELSRIRRREDIVGIGWYEVSSISNSINTKMQDLTPIVDQAIQNLAEVPSAPDTADFIYHKALLQFSKHHYLGDYREGAKILEAALQKMGNLPFLHITGFIALQLNLISCYMSLRDRPAAERCIDEYMVVCKAKSNLNSFKMAQLRCLLAFQVRDYSDAYRYYKQAVDDRTFPKYKAYLEESYTTYNVYLYILHQAGYLPEYAAQRSLRPQRFLNEVPEFSKDKQRRNIPILISHFILLLFQKKYDSIIDRYEAIAKYRDRYLDKHRNYRANLFFRILAEVVRADFHLAPFERRSRRYRDLLDTVPPNVIEPTYDQEIISYEALYDIIRENLEGAPVGAKRRLADTPATATV